jgi:hypothetical protein
MECHKIFSNMGNEIILPLISCSLTNQGIRAGLHYGGEGLRSVKNAWPRHGYMRQMVDVLEKN